MCVAIFFLGWFRRLLGTGWAVFIPRYVLFVTWTDVWTSLRGLLAEERQSCIWAKAGRGVHSRYHQSKSHHTHSLPRDLCATLMCQVNAYISVRNRPSLANENSNKVTALRLHLRTHVLRSSFSESASNQNSIQISYRSTITSSIPSSRFPPEIPLPPLICPKHCTRYRQKVA